MLRIQTAAQKLCMHIYIYIYIAINYKVPAIILIKSSHAENFGKRAKYLSFCCTHQQYLVMFDSPNKYTQQPTELRLQPRKK